MCRYLTWGLVEKDTKLSIKTGACMALVFKEIESFKFGDLEVTPQMSTEQKLRVQNLKMAEGNEEEIREVLSACFGDKATEVKIFMERNLFLLDYIQIQVYLTQGQAGLDSLNQRMDKYMDKKVDQLISQKGANE